MCRNPLILLLALMLLVACSSRVVVPPGGTASVVEDQLVAAFDTFYANAYSEAYNNRYRQVRDSLKGLLANSLREDIPLDQPLPKLAESVRMVASADGRLRFFSWDEQSGGTMHDMAVVAQFATEDGGVQTQVLDRRLEQDEWPVPDIIVGEVHQLADQTGSYLCLGWGTYGSGHHHQAARILRIEQDTLMDCPGCFDGKPHLTVLASRRDSIGLHFDPANGRLSHREFESDEYTGFMRPTGAEIVWKWKNGRFVRE